MVYGIYDVFGCHFLWIFFFQIYCAVTLPRNEIEKLNLVFLRFRSQVVEGSFHLKECSIGCVLHISFMSSYTEWKAVKTQLMWCNKRPKVDSLLLNRFITYQHYRIANCFQQHLPWQNTFIGCLWTFQYYFF